MKIENKNKRGRPSLYSAEMIKKAKQREFAMRVIFEVWYGQFSRL